MSKNGSDFAPGYSGTAPSEFALRWRKLGYNPTAGRPVLLYLHAALGLASEALSCFQPPTVSFFKMLDAIVDSGYMIVSVDMGGINTYGNDTAMSRIDDAITYAQANGGRSGAVQMLGTSMGGGAAMVYAKRTPANVKSVTVTSALCSLNDFKTNNRAGIGGTAVDAAYGGSYSDGVYGATKSPVLFASSLTVPGQMWHSTDDTTCPSSFADTVAAAWPGVDYHKSAVGDHGSEQASAWFLANLATILQFLDAHK